MLVAVNATETLLSISPNQSSELVSLDQLWFGCDGTWDASCNLTISCVQQANIGPVKYATCTQPMLLSGTNISTPLSNCKPRLSNCSSIQFDLPSSSNGTYLYLDTMHVGISS